jgi:hypothetical protein
MDCGSAVRLRGNFSDQSITVNNFFESRESGPAVTEVMVVTNWRQYDATGTRTCF